jgi:hypothetical protein
MTCSCAEESTLIYPPPATRHNNGDSTARSTVARDGTRVHGAGVRSVATTLSSSVTTTATIAGSSVRHAAMSGSAATAPTAKPQVDNPARSGACTLRAPARRRRPRTIPRDFLPHARISDRGAHALGQAPSRKGSRKAASSTGDVLVTALHRFDGETPQPICFGSSRCPLPIELPEASGL